MNFSSLARTISCLFESAVISGHFTNHSLRATAATRMFDAGVDEQLIMNCTGHSSTSGMRSYKRITTGLKEMTFNVLNESEPEKFKTEKFEPEKFKTEKFAESDENSKPEKITPPSINLAGSSNFTINFNYK